MLDRIARAPRPLTILEGAYLERDGSNVVPFRKPEAHDTMKNEREWAKELDYLLSVLQAEQKADAKAFYAKPANPIHDTNGNARARFLAEKMRATLPHVEHLVRA